MITVHKPIVTLSDVGPSPSIFVAKIDTLMSVEGGQLEEEMSNTWVHWVSHPQYIDTGIVVESQITSAVVESE